MLPIILCAPKFLDGSMTLGQVMQAASAFTIVQDAFNWLVDNYPQAGRLDRLGPPRGLADGRRWTGWSVPRQRTASAASSISRDGEGAAMRLRRPVGRA